MGEQPSPGRTVELSQPRRRKPAPAADRDRRSLDERADRSAPPGTRSIPVAAATVRRTLAAPSPRRRKGRRVRRGLFRTVAGSARRRGVRGRDARGADDPAVRHRDHDYRIGVGRTSAAAVGARGARARLVDDRHAGRSRARTAAGHHAARFRESRDRSEYFARRSDRRDVSRHAPRGRRRVERAPR